MKNFISINLLTIYYSYRIKKLKSDQYRNVQEHVRTNQFAIEHIRFTSVQLHETYLHTF